MKIVIMGNLRLRTVMPHLGDLMPPFVLLFAGILLNFECSGFIIVEDVMFFSIFLQFQFYYCGGMFYGFPFCFVIVAFCLYLW